MRKISKNLFFTVVSSTQYDTDVRCTECGEATEITKVDKEEAGKECYELAEKTIIDCIRWIKEKEAQYGAGYFKDTTPENIFHAFNNGTEK